MFYKLFRLYVSVFIVLLLTGIELVIIVFKKSMYIDSEVKKMEIMVVLFYRSS